MPKGVIVISFTILREEKEMFQVKKRDGSLVEFDMSKIATALSKAFNAKQVNYTADILNMLTLRVSADFSKKIKDNVISVEDIQDSAEVVLIQAGYVDVAKSYILYRKQREKEPVDPNDAVRHDLRDKGSRIE